MNLLSFIQRFHLSKNCILAIVLSSVGLSACSGGSGSDSYNSVADSSGSGTISRGNTSGSTNQLPVAVSDEVITDPFNPITINILSNDFGLGDQPLNIDITSLPDFGNISVDSNNSVIFTPNSDYIGKDAFTYVVNDSNGDSATAIVTLDIRCTDCTPASSMLTLVWNPNPDNIEGYIVNYGYSANLITETASVLYINSSDIDSRSPSVQYDIYKDLDLNPGEQVCFSIKAFNTVGTSSSSKPVCTVI